MVTIVLLVVGIVALVLYAVISFLAYCLVQGLGRNMAPINRELCFVVFGWPIWLLAEAIKAVCCWVTGKFESK